ncbi:LPS export ABC transporter permease LptG [Chelatococcus asaccharovorans]|uniref:Lipopolysaccharide export system permease protein n=1 Tax=Chelatococcus asaccharovorans TaxID=28210 RepID=A0A2V3UAJ2_9HYPH|nr:LPS export ABC transporter permease LptG [Chelatococcus asaccharovorans]MBS7703214.1 LPS export ABC transporter permease LptG [Chelatococcus asaccharovorans]PXW61544.1 lipopolysaccharide export system permease protein [Chelatococcus asaccharovorans]CAH1672661.1 Lipopolysaccharide export system permease protein [Chelatococcus asaccharovorans]CAH1675930.1 Lipopolysaccharide export system permease protein [Chelatococcus asaccharovorans]
MLIGVTLGRYLSLRFLKTILAVFATVFLLVYTLDFVELMRRAGDAQGASTGLMVTLALLRTPAVVEQVMPFAVLFGSMVTLLNLSRRLELVIARAAGISAWQFLQPGVFIALALGIAVVTLYNPLSAMLKQRAGVIEARVFARSSAATTGQYIWVRQRSVDGQAIVRADAASNDSATLVNVTFFLFDPHGQFTERVEAREADLHSGYWELKDARVTSATSEPETHTTYLIATNLEPSQVRESFLPAGSVPFWRLPSVIERTERAGLDSTPYRLQLDSLLARPLLFVAMVMVAASVSLRFFRFGGVARMVLSGVVAGFMLYVATELMEDLGASGLVSPMVAAWFAAVVGSLLGTLALLYQEDG